MTRTRLPLRFITIAVIAIVVLVAAACSGGDSGPSETTTIEGLPPEFQRLSEVWELLNREAIDREDLDPLVIADGAIRGMLTALGDPYAGFLNREQFSLESEDIRGFFGGIDCNDQQTDINPDARENCLDNFDNNCNERTDCQDAQCTGQTRTCSIDGGAGVATCQINGTWSPCGLSAP